MNLGGYSTGVQSWTYQPLNTGQEYTVAEITQGYSSGNQISASAGFSSYVYGSADISNLSDNWYVPTFSSAPTGLNVTVAEVYPRGAKLRTSITSYGVPSSASGRAIEAGIAAQNAWVSPALRSQLAYSVLSADIVVDNNSVQTTTLTIEPNTHYYYGGHADNTQASVGGIFGQLTTLADVATVTIDFVTGRTATFNYSVDADGGYYSKILEYSLDGGTTWATAATIATGSATTGSFTITGLNGNTTYTLKSRMTTTAGSTNNTDVNFTTLTLLYGSVEGTAKGINKLYGSVGGQTKEITKLYGSVGGVTKRIF